MPSPSPDAPASPRRRASSFAGLIARILGRLAVGVALAVASLLLLVYALGFLSAPSTLSVLRAESETLRYRVANAQQASFLTRGFRLYGEGEWSGACAEAALGAGLAIEPQLEAEVIYSVTAVEALGPEPRLLIEIAGFEDGRPSAVLRGGGGARSVASDMALAADASCGSTGSLRLPVWGPGEIGGAPTFRADGPTPTLLSGSLEMYGRATPTPLPLVDWMADLVGVDIAGGGVTSDDRTLYASLSSAFQIPPGSRVSTLDGDADPSLKALRGFARMTDGRLEINVSTESPGVYFYPPGAGKRPDQLKTSLFSQIGNDPNIQTLLQIVIWFVVVLPIALELVKPLFLRRDEED